MRYLNLLSLVAAAAVAAAVGWSINHVVGGAHRSLLILPWASLLAELAAALAVGYLWLRLRAYRNPGKAAGRRRDPARRAPYDPVWAVGTAAAAQATAYYGALCAGWHAGIGVDQLALLGMRSTQEPLWQCIAQVVAGIALAVLGWVVEKSCRLPPDDPDAEEETPYGGRPDPYPTGEGGYARDH
ncbi:DUF3180 domain-containing protein [Kocuria tytonis]|uniref:DUF3180 domain-containing protein n=1 Tax=Kocuria tytonis TaxID=2054280 RepID=A0A495A2E5_9MICC|nr:DUF3180 domain-containing protein [Kocuria tytonis]RKQ33667.1 DUF3180 domain-containing protein [Kocuria tytonis]